MGEKFIPTAKNYYKFVSIKTKPSLDLIEEITPLKADLNHAALGIADEAGELVGVIKKHTMYDKPLDMAHLIEEMGDLMFYLQHLKNLFRLTDEEIIQANIDKLTKRYPKGYTNHHAAARLDKQEDSTNGEDETDSE